MAASAVCLASAVTVLAVSCSSGDGEGEGAPLLAGPTTSSTTSSTPPVTGDPDSSTPISCGATVSTGCSCDTPGQQLACGQVHRSDGDYISCSPGYRTCSAAGAWGDCVGDQVGDPHGPTRGFVLESLQLDASGCTGNPCDPTCQNFIDTASGVDAGPDTGLVWNDAGVSLVPNYSDSGPACTSFSIAPLAQTITVTSIPLSTASSTALPTVTYSSGQQYKATVSPVGCFTGVVPALWGMDRNDLGTFDATTGLLTIFTGIATATPINIAGFVGGFGQQTTTATVLVNAVDTSAAGTYTSSSFSGSTTSTDPGAILYPYDSTVLPLGLQPPIVQWSNGGTSASAVKVTLRYPDTSPVFTWSGITSTESPATTSVPGLTSATGLAAAPRYALDANVWNDFAQSAKGNANTMTNPGVISIQRISSTTGKLYPELKVKVYFASGQLKGKVYYQSYETQLVKNSNYTVSGGGQVGAATLAITPGASAPTLVAGVAGTTAGEGCRVCHVVSGDGSTLLTQVGNSYGQTRRFGLTTGTPWDTNFTTNTGGLFAWAALTPAADYALSHAGPAIATGPGTTYSTLYSMSTGTAIGSTGLASTFKGATPSFSPDETHLTFNYYSYDNRSLGIYDFNPATLKFTNLRSVYTPPGTGYVVWPTYTPASNQIIFGTQYSGGFGETWQSGTADLWRYDVATGKTDQMAKANGVNLPSGTNHVPATDAVMNFEPTMNPTATSSTGGFAWVVFTSRRLFGNVAVLPPACSDARSCASDLTSPTPKKLWMAAVNPNTAGGTDPSAPAFYLPGQELLAGNSRGFWVLDQCKAAGTTSASSCDSDLDCCQSPDAERCVASTSTPPITKYCTALPSAATCSADNTTCTSTSNCCGAVTGSQCVLNVCTPPPPLVTFSGSSFTRDYVGSCPNDQTVVWRYFSWQSYTPGNSTIQFAGQTAATSALITSSTPMVAIGTAQSNAAWAVPAQTPTWTSAATTVDNDFVAAGLSSQSTLRVTAYLNPATSPSQTPVLEDWRATYDCVANK